MVAGGGCGYRWQCMCLGVYVHEEQTKIAQECMFMKNNPKLMEREKAFFYLNLKKCLK